MQQAPNICRVEDRSVGSNKNFRHRAFYRSSEHAFDRMTFTVPATERANVREYLNTLHNIWFKELHDSEGGTSTFLLSADSEKGFEQLAEVIDRLESVALPAE